MKQVRMYYRSGTGGGCCIRRRADTVCRSPDGSTFLREMTSKPPSWNYDVKSKIWLPQSIYIYSGNNPHKFPPDPVWNDGALGFLKKSPQKEQQSKDDDDE